MKSFKMWIAVVLAVGVTAGCYGPFNLTRKLHKWNGEVSHQKWVQEGVFLGMVILPVYAFASLGDMIIFNSIEFWGGKNPIQVSTKSIEKDGQQVVMKYDGERGRLRVDGFVAGRPSGTVVFEPGPAGMVAKDGRGKVLMTARTEGDQVVLSDAQGRAVSRHDVRDIEGKL